MVLFVTLHRRRSVLQQSNQRMTKSNNMATQSSYLPVAWEYRETLEEEMKKATRGKIFYFDGDNQLEQTEGRILEITEHKGAGIFIRLEHSPGISNSQSLIRIDRIITLFGKIGAAYDEYDAFANACMDCKGD
jgi:hypothetical protein